MKEKKDNSGDLFIATGPYGEFIALEKRREYETGFKQFIEECTKLLGPVGTIPNIRKSISDMPNLFKQGVNCYYNRQRFQELLWKYRNIQKPKAEKHTVESKKGYKHRI